mmetsp:Transcript_31248/g.35579  ORF Transcript_31248/g.35579 Transcript_31248/m.35579 type:complete len:237 (-) Transcript_31248:1003-1713(-)
MTLKKVKTTKTNQNHSPKSVSGVEVSPNNKRYNSFMPSINCEGSALKSFNSKYRQHENEMVTNKIINTKNTISCIIAVIIAIKALVPSNPFRKYINFAVSNRYTNPYKHRITLMTSASVSSGGDIYCQSSPYAAHNIPKLKKSKLLEYDKIYAKNPLNEIICLISPHVHAARYGMVASWSMSPTKSVGLFSSTPTSSLTGTTMMPYVMTRRRKKTKEENIFQCRGRPKFIHLCSIR